MRLTVRRRALLVGALLLAAGYLWVTWSLTLGLDLGHSIHGEQYPSCPGPAWKHLGYTCGSSFDRTRVVALLVVIAVLVMGFGYLAVRWVLSPVRTLAGVADRMGPQNLGERVADLGGDEVGRAATAVNALLERLAAGYESQRRFAATASHELRTPLALQRALIEVSLASAPGPEQLELVARQLLAANHRNERLVEGLLALAESDRGLASRVPVRLDQLVAAVCAQYEPVAVAARITIATELAETVVAGEEVLLARLVANLLHNGIKYNRAGGRVALQVAADRTLRVANSGDAVPPEAVPTLFEPFRRLAGERIDHDGGSGLGLAIVRSIAVAHEATVVAEAQPAGGLRVTVRFAG